jgi:hypothetical protein
MPATSDGNIKAAAPNCSNQLGSARHSSPTSPVRYPVPPSDVDQPKQLSADITQVAATGQWAPTRRFCLQKISNCKPDIVNRDGPRAMRPEFKRCMNSQFLNYSYRANRGEAARTKAYQNTKLSSRWDLTMQYPNQ